MHLMHDNHSQSQITITYTSTHIIMMRLVSKSTIYVLAVLSCVTFSPLNINTMVLRAEKDLPKWKEWVWSIELLDIKI